MRVHPNYTGEGEVHLHELSKLAEKDPEFYKYLQENDKELLDFDPSAHPDVDMDGDDEDEGDEDMDGQETEERLPILTMKTLTQWQKVLLQVHSPCIKKCSIESNNTLPLAKVITFSTKTPSSVSVRCTYERRRPGPCVEYRQRKRYGLTLSAAIPSLNAG